MMALYSEVKMILLEVILTLVTHIKNWYGVPKMYFNADP